LQESSLSAFRCLFVVAGALLLAPAVARGQSAAATVRYGEPVRLPVAEEIALARSAAPTVSTPQRSERQGRNSDWSQPLARQFGAILLFKST
jgi:hypothetical protein